MPVLASFLNLVNTANIFVATNGNMLELVYGSILYYWDAYLSGNEFLTTHSYAFK